MQLKHRVALARDNARSYCHCMPFNAPMTASLLLATLVAAWLLQLALGVGVWVWRRRGHAMLAPRPASAQAPRVAQGAWAGWRDFRVERREFEDDGQTQCSFYLVPVDGVPLPPFKPGQFLTFQFMLPPDRAAAAPVTLGAARTLTRCYSLSDRPDPKAFRITVKRVPAPAHQPDWPPGAVSNYLHDHVHEGDVLQVRAPAGHFYLDAAPDVPVVLIGGGIGITPMMSMLRWCLDEQPGRPVHLYYGVRNRAEQAFKPTLEALAAAHPALRLNVVYSQPGAADVPGRDFQHAGRVDVDLLRRTLPHGRHQFYICGPAPMMESLVPALAAWGVAPADIHFEAFGPASVPSLAPASGEAAPAPVGPVEIRFSQTGRTVVWDGQDNNLLDFAERHGVAVESGCRSGGCGSCQVGLTGGDVRYVNTPDFDVAPGHCLLCVGTPATALVLEA